MDVPVVPAETVSVWPKDRIIRLVKQFSKFVIVGGINTGIDFAVLYGLVTVTGITHGYELFILNAISFSVAVINSYFMNKYWTFEDKTKTQQEPFKFSQFLIISVIGIGINGGILTLITGNVIPLFGLSERLWVLFAKLMATGVSLVWNFVGYKLFVFKK
ncbi:MAG: GtrA family protein [Candidatus Moraniibacteriota bacterium]